MKNSEIFDAFVKIAQEKGMISNDSSEAKKIIEETGRASSQDISTIEALYGVKPEVADGMKYDLNIMELAHPNSVVVMPAHDKINGLVENNIERQNILLHIVNKPNNGHYSQRKLAEKDLILSLVRLGNDLDTAGESELSSFADYCLVQATDGGLKKQAFWPLAIGVGAIIGGIYLKNHLPMISDGLEADHAKLLSEIDDLLNSNSNWGVGSSYKGQFTQVMQSFRGKLEQFHSTFKAIEPIIADIEKPRDAKELLAKSKEPETGRIAQAIDAFREGAEYLLPEIQKIIKNFSDESYKQRQTENKGFLSSLVDATQVLHGGNALVADDFDDVRHALETYLKDIQGIREVLAKAGTMQQQVAAEMQEASAKSSELFGSKPGEAASKPAAAPREKTVEDLDKESDELSKALLSFQS